MHGLCNNRMRLIAYTTVLMRMRKRHRLRWHLLFWPCAVVSIGEIGKVTSHQSRAHTWCHVVRPIWVSYSFIRPSERSVVDLSVRLCDAIRPFTPVNTACQDWAPKLWLQGSPWKRKGWGILVSKVLCPLARRNIASNVVLFCLT